MQAIEQPRRIPLAPMLLFAALATPCVGDPGHERALEVIQIRQQAHRPQIVALVEIDEGRQIALPVTLERICFQLLHRVKILTQSRKNQWLIRHHPT